MDVVIVGAGGHGRVVLDILRAAGKHRVKGFLDANPDLHGSLIEGVKVLGHLNVLPRLKAKRIRGAIVAIGDNRARQSYAAKLAAAGLKLINAIHPSAVISATAKLGDNLMIAPGAIICTGAIIGDSVIINTAATVDHECEIREAAHICPGVRLAGRVVVGEGAMVGIGACVLPCLKIGARAVVGGGALVRREVAAGSVVAGVPARLLKPESSTASI